jgi:hypothetical protein
MICAHSSYPPCWKNHLETELYLSAILLTPKFYLGQVQKIKPPRVLAAKIVFFWLQQLPQIPVLHAIFSYHDNIKPVRRLYQQTQVSRMIHHPPS